MKFVFLSTLLTQLENESQSRVRFESSTGFVVGLSFVVQLLDSVVHRWSAVKRNRRHSNESFDDGVYVRVYGRCLSCEMFARLIVLWHWIAILIATTRRPLLLSAKT